MRKKSNPKILMFRKNKKTIVILQNISLYNNPKELPIRWMIKKNWDMRRIKS